MSAVRPSIVAALALAALALGACGPPRGGPYHEPGATKGPPAAPAAAPSAKAAAPAR